MAKYASYEERMGMTPDEHKKYLGKHFPIKESHSKSTPRSKALKGEKEFEKWRGSRTGTHSKKISKELGIKHYE